MSIFTRAPEEYKREINPILEYKKQVAFYLSKTRSIDIQTATSIVETKLTNKEIPIKDKELVCYKREENGDNNIHHTSLINYIRETVVNNLILAPTFTNYIPESVKRSPLVDFIDLNVANRSKAKKEGFKAKVLGDMVTYNFKNNEQNNLKTYNNSLSGTFATKGSILCNPTAHSTLTTTTRIETSLANTLNEKIIAGNRHYRTPDITLNNINFLAYIANKEQIEATIAKYNLVYPTPAQVSRCINSSTSQYWINGEAYYKIDKYLETLEPYELASIMYTNDLYHIRQLNPDFIHNFIMTMISKIPYQGSNDLIKEMETIPDPVVNLAHQICINEVRGIGKDYTKLSEDKLSIVLGTCKHIISTMEEYADFFKTFFVTDDVPASVAYIKSMVRKVVVLSDTDSTMFSCDEWVMWHYDGIFRYTDEGIAIAGVIGFISSQVIAHSLAIYSANLGVSTKRIFQMQMKPEYVFPVFIQAPVSKHYFTCIAMQEGNVYNKLDYEIKGVHLKNSALPKEVIKAAHDKMKAILYTIMDNKPILLRDEIKEVIALENKYREDISSNKEYYFRKTTIKDVTSYKLEEDKCPYWHYKLWCNVFEPKYGQISAPPYRSFILPLTINNKTDMAIWLAKIEDRELSDRLANFIKSTNKETIRTINISEDYTRAFGIPKEILMVLDIKRIILDLTLSRRIIIDSLGFTPKTDMLFSEY